MFKEDFVNYMLSKDVSENTIKNYNSDIKHFINFIKEEKRTGEDMSVRNTNITDLINYMALLKKEGLSKATRSRKATCLRSFWSYLKKTGKVVENVAVDLEKPKLDKKLPIYLNTEEASQLMKSCNNKRDYCIITLFLNCGLRLSELTNLELEDIKVNIIKVKGKGNKERTVYLNKDGLEAISGYLDIRPKVESKRLFISRLGDGLTVKAVSNVVKKCIKTAGLDVNKYSTHKLRHSFASALYGQCKDLRVVQELLGHSNISTTQIYVHMNEQKLENTINSFSY